MLIRRLLCKGLIALVPTPQKDVLQMRERDSKFL